MGATFSDRPPATVPRYVFLPAVTPEPATLKVVTDDEPEDQEVHLEVPEFTPEILAKMFANMQAHGLL